MSRSQLAWPLSEELSLLEQMEARTKIRTDLTRWVRRKGFEPARHHALIVRKLEQVAAGKLPRLALFLPPGSAKSTYASVLFPPWYLARKPNASIIAASHTAELAERWGRRVRNLIAEDGVVLGYGLASDSQAAGRWDTDRGGEYFAVGVGGAVTGRRADLAIIDDPVRSREDADSETVRNRTWDWYRFDLLTRLKPNAAIVLIQTRWHEDDLAGRILAEGRGDWDVVSIPMEAGANDPIGRQAGELLWPEWYTGEQIAEAKRDARVWSALYQQEPAPETGDYFKADWFRYYTTEPDLRSLTIYGGSDYAVTADGGDFTVHVVVGVDPDDRMFLLDVWREQAASDVWVDAWCDLVKVWKPLAWAEEQGQIKSGIGPFLTARANEKKAYCAREAFTTRQGNKAVRAQSFRGRMASKGLYVNPNKPWWPDFRAELLAFPAGKHDDQVDACGLVGQLLDMMIPGSLPKKADPVVRDAYRSADDDLAGQAGDSFLAM